LIVDAIATYRTTMTILYTSDTLFRDAIRFGGITLLTTMVVNKTLGTEIGPVVIVRMVFAIWLNIRVTITVCPTIFTIVLDAYSIDGIYAFAVGKTLLAL
jgi:hypothetical protein